jgi:ATP-dependent Lon protease
VRNLERELANLTRKAVKEIMSGEAKTVSVTPHTLGKFAGVKRFQYGEAEAEDLVGVTTGLAWTEVGGELLSIEAVMVPGKGRIIITGKLGDVMQESVQAAKSYVQSRAIQFGVPPTTFAKKDIHVHVPEGATPKDGPSAGVAMVTSIVSVMTGIAVRKDVAMTGEITLRGRVLRIGGLKEKLLAAHRGGLRRVLIPKDNERELSEIPQNITHVLEIIPVATVDEVLANALVSELSPIEWDEKAELEAAIAVSRVEEDEVPGVITH